MHTKPRKRLQREDSHCVSGAPLDDRMDKSRQVSMPFLLRGGNMLHGWVVQSISVGVPSSHATDAESSVCMMSPPSQTWFRTETLSSHVETASCSRAELMLTRDPPCTLSHTSAALSRCTCSVSSTYTVPSISALPAHVASEAFVGIRKHVDKREKHTHT